MAGIALRCPNLTRATLSHARSSGRALCWVALGELGIMGPVLALAIVAEAAIVCEIRPLSIKAPNRCA
jgi:hypothetical protein